MEAHREYDWLAFNSAVPSCFQARREVKVRFIGNLPSEGDEFEVMGSPAALLDSGIADLNGTDFQDKWKIDHRFISTVQVQ
jgi:hypothetical protein